MQTIGLIGGMSWESTQLYYQLINREVHRRLGGLHSARCIVYSVDFAEVEALAAGGEWASAGRLLGGVGAALRDASCDFLVLCTNTMHAVACEIERISRLPLLHIADATARELQKLNVQTVGLLGTRYTMAGPFYKSRLARHGYQAIVPDDGEQSIVHDVIFKELARGVVSPKSKEAYLGIVERLRSGGAQAIVLGCTEIGMLLKDGDAAIPLVDTTQAHAIAAVDRALMFKGAS